MSKNMIQWLEIGDLDIHISDGNYSSKYPRSEEFIESGVPFIRANNLVNKSISDEEMYFISPQKHGLLKKGHLKTNDVLISTRGDLGKVALVPKRYNDSNINAQLVLLRPNPHKIDPLYLLYCFEGDRVKGQISQLQTGTALKQLPVGNLKRIKIPLPPLEEQRRIAAILDKADGVRRKRKEAIRLTEELLKSTFLEMFGDPVTNPKGWEVTILRDVCKKVTDGTHHMPKTVEKGIPILRALNIKKDKVETSNLLYISEEDYQKISKRSPLDKGDVLLTCLGTIGNVAIFNEDSNFSLVRNIALLKPNYKKTTSEFLKFILKTDYLQRQIKSRSKQSSQAALYIGEIEQLKIFLPPIELQRKYSNLSQEINDLHKKLEQDEFYQDNLFNSLLQKAFRGEL
ncbi:MAG: restriction endonuclease subunit S [Microcystis aeruginosa Ma_MB_F_20061100_S19]|uniref:Type I restriction enzyme EcoKI specificity protein n=1 Tax=Microcystis aeruginosa SPC777 TaxID=482300 RepID=S3KDC3_MICAE|nr:restriction endonuclease subunit S [Microcystis aeruginosa]NCR99780.1 restriction endonuclease subunit S [Microcystis aeruginosa L311-01]OCY12410.1 MAG: type I restriction endonuclease subunit S [Microcystis aeruginosa CACIAM 03]TRU10321.1 MAG: restriction endonuclease subunit S [Microcystis aeruginosa Ma_MB_F_20061100_S19]TRU13681.1 MAG: restriction endonuclease subunit S [Microcystis aeruginosa Ma_MB_F_20061100_S19D]EPF22789.1 Type I restriction enzyme EcoKI specificity protein [Microcyst